MTFEAIAIIGQSCLLPGALNPQQLWQNLLAGKSSLQAARREEWRVNPQNLMIKTADHHYIDSDQCGFIEGFETVFDPTGFCLPPDQILAQDQLCQWLAHGSREALHAAGYDLNSLSRQKAGLIVGNLSYPTTDLSRYAEAVWLNQQAFPDAAGRVFQSAPARDYPNHRFMSGFPTLFMAQALGLNASCYALDAACASALYAIELACRQLQERKADLMFSGGINGADGLFLNLGFTTLHALSPSGQSRPLHREADGLIPSQGLSLLVLKRLEDAIADQDTVIGVIRGIGLSNDGSSRGFLVPAQNGQVAAMRAAYAQSDIRPEQISWVECHATGTPLGDATEIASMDEIYGDQEELSIGALKANIGHSITASGAAAIIKVLAAFKAGVKPPTLYAPEAPSTALDNTPFRLSATALPWEPLQGRRLAAINCFGFGGNNAHLLLEQFIPETSHRPVQVSGQTQTATPSNLSASQEIAVVGIGIIAASTHNRQEFMEAWLQKKSLLTEYYPGLLGGYLDQVELDVKNSHFPPADLKRSLGQQLAMLKAAQEALAQVQQAATPDRSAIWIGMQCDAEGARPGFSCRLTDIFPQADPEWLNQARNAILPPLLPADIIGAMPNIVTNRLNLQFDFRAPSFSISAEEVSGLIALDLGISQLREGRIDLALIGAVDMCCEPVHRAAAVNRLPASRQIPGDAAVTLVLKRLEDARSQGDTIYAVISEQTEDSTPSLSLSLDNSSITQQFGHAHAASGLLHVAAAALACHEKRLPEGYGSSDGPNGMVAEVQIDSYGGETRRVVLRENSPHSL